MSFRQMYEEKYMRFPQGKAKALSFSYDDGVKADKKLVGILDKYGLKGTFNLNNLLFDCENWHGRMDEEETYKTFSGGNHEVAIHGARHIFLDKVPLAEAVNEVLQNRLYLENKFKKIVRGMAYAYNGYNDKIIEMLKGLGVAYARTTENTHGFSLPQDWLKLNPTCHHTDAEIGALSDKFFGSSPDGEFKHREPWFFLVWGHSYEFDDDNNWQVIENLAKRAAKSGDVWFATCGEVYDYCKAYERLVFSLDGERVFNPSHISVWIEIRGKVYEVPAGGEVEFEK
ncbi:MAG: polysaccharide deacetylase family protein [Clostridia bacterium]|nr:polysaccharide deacetylase family protein [Clostridia bacterium]